METENVKHIKNFNRVRKQIIAHYDREQKDLEESLAQAKDFLERVRRGEKGIKWPSTGFDVTERDCVYQISRMENLLRPPYRGRPRNHTVFWWRQQALDRLDRADRAPVFAGLKVRIEWVRSRTWGCNPVAECWVFGNGPAIYVTKDADGKTVADRDGKPYLHSTHFAVGKASGAGYDKRSAAVENGIMCPTIDRLIVEHEKTWEFYAVDGKDDFPHLSIGGKGVDVLRSLFKGYGEKPPIPWFDWRWEEGRSWDLIEVTPKSKKGD